MNISLRVKNLVKKYDTCNPYQLAKELHIDIYELDLPSSIRGFFIRPRRRKSIIINRNMTEAEKLVAVAHELGHARLHKGYGMLMKANLPYFRSTKRETEANEFAAHLLSYDHDFDVNKMQQVIQKQKPDTKYIHNYLTGVIYSDIIPCKICHP